MNLMQILHVEKPRNLNIGAVVLKVKSQTRSSLTWAVLERKVLRPTPDLLNQKLWGSEFHHILSSFPKKFLERTLLNLYFPHNPITSRPSVFRLLFQGIAKIGVILKDTNHLKPMTVPCASLS